MLNIFAGASPVGRLARVSLAVLTLSLSLTFTNATVQAADTWQVAPNNRAACTRSDPRCAAVGAAIQAAASGDTIKVGPGTFVENLTLTKSLTIQGSGAGITILDGGYGAGCTGTAPLSKSAVAVPSGKTVAISDLTIRHGCKIGDGSPILEGGGVDNHGTTTLTRVIVANNTVRGRLGGGGGISNETATGILFLKDVIIANNTAEEAAGLDNDHFATLENVAIFGNKAIGHGRDEGKGGGVENDTLPGAVLTMTNVTVFANSAVIEGGGIANDNRSFLRMTNVTVYSNYAPKHGGILNEGPADRVEVKNSIIANNANGNCGGKLTGFGENLATDASCGAAFMNKPSARLAEALSDNGGFAPSFALLPDSPAIDAARDCLGLATDQRGQARPVASKLGGVQACDLGAFEFNPDGPRPTSTLTKAPTTTAMSLPTTSVSASPTNKPSSGPTIQSVTTTPSETPVKTAKSIDNSTLQSAPRLASNNVTQNPMDPNVFFIVGGALIGVLGLGILLLFMVQGQRN